MSVGGSGGSAAAGTGTGGGQGQGHSQGIAIPNNKRIFSRIRTDSEQSSNSFTMPPDDDPTKDTRSMSLAPVTEQIIEEEDEKQRMLIDNRNNSVISRFGGQSNQGDDMLDEDMLMYEMIESGVPPPPDGGWGWVIVFASFACNLIVDGIAYTFGVFLPKFALEFVPQDENREPGGKIENGSVPWVGSLLCGIYLCVGPIVSALTNKFGCRRVCIVGSFIAALGFALSSFANSLPILMLTYGVIGGIGFGFIYLPAVVCVGYYFETKRAVATGIAVCGSGVGTFVFAPFATWLLQQTDWRNANLVLSALIFTCAIFGALMRPLEVERRPLDEGYDEGQDDPEKRGHTQNRSLLQRMADDKRNYMEKSSIAGSAYFMVQLPDGTMERRLKLPLNVDPGVHSSFNLDQLVPGSPIHNVPSGNALTVPASVPNSQQQQSTMPSVGGGLPTITEVKIPSNNPSAPNSSEESSQSGSGEIVKSSETDSVPKDKKPKSKAVSNENNDTNANADIDEMNFLSESGTTPATSPPIPIPEAIEEEKEGEESHGTSFDSSEGVQLSASAMAAKRRMRERRSSEGMSLSPPSSAGMRGSPMKIMASAGGPRKSVNIGMPNTVAPTSFVRIPRNESAPQFMYGRSLPKNGSVPLFDRMVARKHSFRAVPVGSSVVRNTSKPNLQDRRASKASIASRNNNYGNQLDEDYNSLWSRSELNEGLVFSTSRKSSEPRHIVRPLSRKDIFYSGSIAHLPEYQSTKDIGSYRQSILNLPRASGAVGFTTGGDEGDGEGGELLTGAISPTKIVKPRICPCLPGISGGSFKTALAQLMDFSLLKNPVFLFVAISNVFGMLGFYVPFVFLTGAAQANGVPEDIAAYLLSIIGITNTIGRILSGFLSDLPQVNSLLMNNLCILLSGFCVAAVPFCSSFASYVAVATFFGLFVSGYISLTSIILVELLGLDNLTNAFGLLILFRGAASIIGPPVAGAVFDFFSSYDVSFFLAGGFLLVSAFISFLIPCVSKFAPPKPVLEPPAIYGGYYLEDIPEAVESSNTETPNSPTSGGGEANEDMENEKCDHIESSL